MARRHVLGRDRRATDHENVDTGGYRDRGEATRGLRRDAPRHSDARFADLPHTLRDETVVDRGRAVDRLEQGGRLVSGGPPDLLKLRGGIGVARPQALKIEDRRDP